MKRVLKTLSIHLFCIICFAFVYYYFSTNFDNNRQNKFKQYRHESNLHSLMECFLLSTTIQAGVGMSDVIPISTYGSIILIIQQLLMMSINVITIYVFTL